MSVSFYIAHSDAERQECRALAVGCNGHGFCPEGAPPEVLVEALDSFRGNALTWIAGRDDETGELVATECIALSVLPNGGHLAVVGAVRPDVFTVDLGRQLQESLVLTLEGPESDEPDRWAAILSAHSPMLSTILDVYGGEEYVTVTPWEDPRMDLVRLDGLLVNRRPPGLSNGD